jgi:hypothetical protein
MAEQIGPQAPVCATEAASARRRPTVPGELMPLAEDYKRTGVFPGAGKKAGKFSVLWRKRPKN